MKLSQLKQIVKEAVKEAIQEEMKDILLEAVRSSKQTIYENQMSTPTTNVVAPISNNYESYSPLPETDRLKLRENMMSVLDGMRPGANGTLNATTSNIQPLQMVGSMDTTSPNGQLPQGDVSIEMINNIMQGKI
jgi:hypothetical protein